MKGAEIETKTYVWRKTKGERALAILLNSPLRRRGRSLSPTDRPGQQRARREEETDSNSILSLKKKKNKNRQTLIDSLNTDIPNRQTGAFMQARTREK
mmetsp:Transcript_6868/g.13516  ORF Transcript_6868/g.13516 Transcript_6868/m.13516 type:complete len:98 (+) Transcript_6868:441-734(+)